MTHFVPELPKEKEKESTMQSTPPVVEEVETEPEVIMRPEMSLVEASSLILLKQLKKLHKSAIVAQEGNDPEGVHQLRVATRRLRAGLKVLEETGYEPNKTAYFRRELSELASNLGKVRNSDVFLAHLQKYMSELPGEKLVELEPLKKLVLRKQELGREILLATLERKKTARLLAELKEFLRMPGEISRQSDRRAVQRVYVRHFSGSSIWKRYEEVMAFEIAEPFEEKTEILHQLRVACKRLRYTLEFFEEALPAEATGIIEQLSLVQDQLGVVQDQQIATKWINRTQKKYSNNLALQEYLEFREAEATQQLNAFRDRWNSLGGTQFRKALAQLIAE